LNADGDPTTTTVTALTGLTKHYEAKRWDYRLAADYRLSDALLVYGTFSTGFKGGGSNPRPFNSKQVIAFEPEQLTAYEIGFKSDFLDRKVRLNVSAFLNNYKDIQIPVSLCPDAPCAARLNAGDARVKGFEAELTAFPVPGLAIDASLSYLDFHYIASSLNPLAAYPTNPGGILPDDPSTAPAWKANIGAQYKIDLGGAGSLTPRVDVNYQDKQYTGPTVIAGNRIRNFIPAYTLTNARLTWQNADRDLDVSLEVTNATDKYYLLTIFDLRATGAGFRKGRPGNPREWAISVKKKF
jgi:iron complex outermembrane receptor protein